MSAIKLVAVGEDFDESKLLGFVTFFSLPDDAVPADLLLQSWTDNGLSPDGLPEVRQPVHVFQSACASVSDREGNGHGRVEVRTDEVENNHLRCSYQITRVVWDLNNRVIEHEKNLRIEFEKSTNTIGSVKLDHFDPALAELEKQIRHHYVANMATVPGPKVRNAIRAALISLGGQNLRRKAGGVYFVPVTPPGTTTPVMTGNCSLALAALTRVLEALYGDRADLHTIRCANDEGEREMVAKHVALNAAEAARKLTEKAYGRVRQGEVSDRAVRSDLLANLYNERRMLLGSVKHFEELVSLENADVKASIAELDEALEKLQLMADAA